jgi:hypothetical protein
MANWFGRRNTSAKPEYRGAHEVIARLAGLDRAKDLAAITMALEAVAGSNVLALEDRFSEIQKLDGAGQPCLFKMIEEYLATPRHKKARESELWGGAYGYLVELYNAYLSCLQRYEADVRGSTRFRIDLPIAVARALRALRLQLKWALLRYVTPEPRLWTEIAALYDFAVANKLADEQVPFYPGRKITVTEEFVKALMIAGSSHDSLRPAELDLATRLVDHYSQFFKISDEPFEGCSHWFALDHPGRPVRASKAPRNNIGAKYFGAGEALAKIEEVLAEMSYTGEMPQELRFYEKQDNQLLAAALKHLALDWAGKSQARKDERRKITSRVTVVPGLSEIIRALDFAVNDSLDFTDQPAAESWIVEDTSEGGYGAVIPSVAGDWVEVGSVVGVEGASIRDWRIGVIRRVNRMDGDQQRVGVQLLGGDASLVSLSQADARVGSKAAEDSADEPAVLITGKPKRRGDVEILVRSGMFTSLNEVEMLSGNKRYRLKPTRVVERNARSERVAFQLSE